MRHMQRNEEVIEDFGKAILLFPGDVWAFHGRAQAYAELEQFVEAVTDYTSVIGLAPARGYTSRDIANL